MDVKTICGNICKFLKAIILICVILGSVMIVLVGLRYFAVYDFNKVSAAKPLSAAEKLLILESLEND